MSRFVGGSQAIALKVAKALGKRVLLKAPARRIVQDKTGVTVVTDAFNVRAKRAIVAIPPALASRIDYSPLLPWERDQLTQRVGQGTLTKVTVGLRQAVLARPGPDGPGREPRRLRQRDLRRLAAERQPRRGVRLRRGRQRPGLQRALAGRPPQRGAQRPCRLLRRAGQEPRATTSRPTGPRSAGRAAARSGSTGPARWWPTETVSASRSAASTGRAPRPRTYWNGYMDGAVRSGERAAGEVLAAL